jgi:hypothetical protein
MNRMTSAPVHASAAPEVRAKANPSNNGAAIL